MIHFIYGVLAGLSYVIAISSLRSVLITKGLYTTNICPHCKIKMKKYRRKKITKLFAYLTFNLLAFRKVKCKWCDYKTLAFVNSEQLTKLKYHI